MKKKIFAVEDYHKKGDHAYIEFESTKEGIAYLSYLNGVYIPSTTTSTGKVILDGTDENYKNYERMINRQIKAIKNGGDIFVDYYGKIWVQAETIEEVDKWWEENEDRIAKAYWVAHCPEGVMTTREKELPYMSRIIYENPSSLDISIENISFKNCAEEDDFVYGKNLDDVFNDGWEKDDFTKEEIEYFNKMKNRKPHLVNIPNLKKEGKVRVVGKLAGPNKYFCRRSYLEY